MNPMVTTERKPRIAVVAGRIALPPSYFLLSAPRALRQEFEFSFHALRLVVDREDFRGFALQVRRQLTPLHLFRALRARRPHLIHQHWATWSAPATSVAKLRRTPLIVSVHGYDAFLPPSTGAFRFGKDAAKRVERRWALKVATVVVVNSDFMAAQVRALGVEEGRLQTVRHGIDTDFFSPTGSERSGVLFVGRLSPEKGGMLLLDAMALLSHKEERVTFVGDGPQRKDLEQHAKRLGVNAFFLGQMPKGSVRDELRRARLAVVPSVQTRHQAEASGIAPLEAMGCGTPVVVTRVGGLAENIPETLPMLVADANPHDLARAMQSVTDQNWEKLSRTLRQHVVETHSEQAAARSYRDIYKRLLNL